MSKIKLYTEEQVIKFIKKSRETRIPAEFFYFKLKRYQNTK